MLFIAYLHGMLVGFLVGVIVGFWAIYNRHRSVLPPRRYHVKRPVGFLHNWRDSNGRSEPD